MTQAQRTPFGVMQSQGPCQKMCIRDRGYRLYVNELMERRSLSREEEEKLNTCLLYTSPALQGRGHCFPTPQTAHSRRSSV